MMNDGRRNRLARRPFWLPAIPFYAISAIVAAGFFLSTVAILGDDRREAFVSGGLVAAAVLVIAVLLREIIIRNFQINAIAKQKMLERSVLSAATSNDQPKRPEKFGLDQNSKLLSELTRKSEAAKVLAPLAESHREVFELCEQYIAIVSEELPRVGVGSPRLSALTKGRRTAETLHKFHMLRWTEIEVRSQTQSGTGDIEQTAKEAQLMRAADAIDRALQSYPDEHDLISSREVLSELLANVQAAGLVRAGRRSAEDGDQEAADNAFADAAGLLASDRFGSEETHRMRELLENELRHVGGSSR